MTNFYNNMYNPDVLSCLANLSNDEVFTPPEVANKMLDMLPEEIWHDKNATFLDPACKSGIFLREIAKRLLEGLKDEIPDLQERIDHIFHKQLYGIAITELTSLLSRRSVYCSKYPNSKYSISLFDTSSGNIRYERTQHSWQNGKCKFCGAAQSEYARGDELETHAYEWIHTLQPEEIFNMKFDVIIGNPPYQMSDGGNGASASPIYQHFVSQAMKLKPRYLTMIIPARWYAGGKGLDEFRDNMLTDQHIRVLHDFQNASDCFPSVEIKGGICYFLWNRENPGLCQVINHNANGNLTTSKRMLKESGASTFIRFNEAINILYKTKKYNEQSFSSLVSSRKPFGLPTYFRGTKIKQADSIILYENGGTSYISSRELKKGHNLVNTYKVYITRAYGAGETFPHQILNKPLVGEKNTCCTETYLVIGPFKTKKEAENVMSYIQTRFFRFLVLLIKNTQDATSRVYQFVPLQDFSKPWTDEELYAKYGLTEEEIAFIESMIKPMELDK